MDNGPCKVDLNNQTSMYPEGVIPDADVDICLKVLRTIRDSCLSPPAFDADAAVLLSHTHATIVGMIEDVQEIEKSEAQTA